MTRTMAAGAALLATTALAQAGGIERSNQSMAILFEEGTYLQFGLGYSDPDVSGNVGAAQSGDMAPSFVLPSISFRTDITEQLSFALILDEHVGADASYPAGTGYPAATTNADLDGRALTALLRYELPSNFSVYGGIRASQVEGNAFVNFLGNYSLNVDGGTEYGYVLGGAYEVPEIALRVALTYNSQIVHTFTGTDGVGAGAATNFQTTIPESWMLEAQSGIAENTLLFGSIRYVDWSDFQICPTNFVVPGGCLVSYANDTVTYTAGLGRRFTENWSGAVTVLREPQVGGNASNLGPTDGRTSLGLGVTWENEQFEVTGGLQYTWLDDTGPLAATTGVFTDNNAVSAGLRVGIRF